MVSTVQKNVYESLMESAKKIGKLAESERLIADEKNTISGNVIDLIKKEGINKLIMPEEYGSVQIDFTTYTDMIKTVGFYNLSASWLTYFYSLHNSWAAYLPKHRRDEIYHDGGLLADILAPLGRAKRVDGGYILTGTYNFVSGIKHSKWCAVGAVVVDKETPEQIVLVIDADNVNIVENWNSLGLRGSGSHTLVIEDLFIPNDLSFRIQDIQKKSKPLEGPFDSNYLYYNVHFLPAFYVGFPAMSIGGAERAIEEFKKRTENRIRISGEPEKASPRSQRVIAEMMMKLQAAKGLMRTYIEMLEEDTGHKYDPSEYKAIRACIIQYCIDIAQRALLTSGAAALIKGHPLEMIVRDLLAIGTHVTSLYEDAVDAYGKMLFGYNSEVRG
ncbi:acyl-CoA dehydrogenase family protein [Psychrobacillus soli]|uniref:Flavin-dependent monooxygenase n=1 Tax=Psychrobacillus soli TaxID=1543965 RepID=A0A544STW4_9BACI|nr:acyl-CoA dehydrogenase family protein [Psychrobacillus soli]TQR08585.1 flavin-dependent monooxygenase [Psychrobacillus soli]